jgi:hypothetical protein
MRSVNFSLDCRIKAQAKNRSKIKYKLILTLVIYLHSNCNEKRNIQKTYVDYV